MRRALSAIFVLLAAAALLTGCSHKMSRALRQAAERTPLYAEAIADPEEHMGKNFVWGGTIAGGRITDEGTILEIVQNPIDRHERVMDMDASEGRFMAFFPGRSLDPLIYSRGRIITVGGKLVATKEGELGGHPYTFLVLEVSKSKLWKKELLYVDKHGYYINPFYWPSMGPDFPY